MTTRGSETDSLLVKDHLSAMALQNSLSNGSNVDNKKFQFCRGRAAVTTSIFFLFALLIMVVGGLYMAVNTNRWNQHDFDEGQNAVLLYTLADRSPGGNYTIQYARNVTVTTTFAEMASILLPPWYQATRLVLEEDIIDGGNDDNYDPTNPDSTTNNRIMNPTTVQNARKVLLMTRDLLDVCSPVFPTNGLWGKVRYLYKEGYDVLGEYQDLDHAHVAYSPKLWKKRKFAVLHWKANFQHFAERHDNLLHFFFHGVDPEGCYHHDESHLFWGDLEDEDITGTSSSSGTRTSNLPCGGDLATDSLQQLVSVQLSKALVYWKQISSYESVLSVDHEENFHNLRKELRSVMDEYDLVGSIIFPSSNSGIKKKMKTLKSARDLLGQVNDDWTAYNLYVTQKDHKKEQKILAVQIDQEWNDFVSWALSNDLEGTIQGLLDAMTQHT
jgi:hypothetical protein